VPISNGGVVREKYIKGNKVKRDSGKCQNIFSCSRRCQISTHSTLKANVCKKDHEEKSKKIVEN